MIYSVGGYQMIDLTGITINSDSAVTVKNADIANILRNTRKPVQFNNATIGATTVNALATVISDTGAVDGKVYQMGKFTVTTNDDEITFTPV